MNFLRVYTILSLTILSSAQLDIQELFQVDVDNIHTGGCGYVGQARLNRLLTDSVQLADALIAAVDDSLRPSSPFYRPAGRLIRAFFKPNNVLANYNYIKGKYIYIYSISRSFKALVLNNLIAQTQAVRDWLTNGGPVRTDQGQPYLFCFHSWLQLQHMTDYPVDTAGNRIAKIGGDFKAFKDIQYYINKRNAEAARLRIAKRKVYPVSKVLNGKS